MSLGGFEAFSIVKSKRSNEALGRMTRSQIERSLEPVARFEDLASAQDHALVVLAMNLDCLITIDEAQSYCLHADPAFEVAIQEEFRLYAMEQLEKREEPIIPVFGSGVELALLWVCVLLFVFIQQGEILDLASRYQNSSIAVIEGGEWYRPFTALFLHADLEHLMGNIVFGLIFSVLAAHSLGPFTAWALILAAGWFGNMANLAWHYPRPFLSLGASTATFGALGLLVGVGMFQGWLSRSYREGLRMFLPLMAGLVLLSQYGAGGPEVDVSGHIWGFLAGVFLGLPAARMKRSGLG